MRALAGSSLGAIKGTRRPPRNAREARILIRSALHPRWHLLGGIPERGNRARGAKRSSQLE